MTLLIIALGVLLLYFGVRGVILTFSSQPDTRNTSVSSALAFGYCFNTVKADSLGKSK